MQSRWRYLLVSAAAVYALYYWIDSDGSSWHFIDNVNLAIHEAGHFILMPFGKFIMVLGGSLLQVLVPFMFIV